MSEKAAASGLSVKSRGDGGVVTVRCTGRLVLGTNEILYNEVHRLLPEAREIVIDCAELTRMDSTGLGTLVRLYVSAKSKGVPLILVDMGPSIRHLLGITQLFDVLTTIGESGIKMM